MGAVVPGEKKLGIIINVCEIVAGPMNALQTETE